MNKNVLKLFAVAAGAALTGTYLLIRKYSPLSAPTCAGCGEPGVTVLKNKRGHELGVACDSCGSRHVWDRQRNAYMPISEEEWERLVNAANLENDSEGAR
ncbi:MAG: hypothetical protein VYE40_00320 [Myxococcota bacterium]|jgi:hypothetical protein|nr:hypothetical protein [Myxococcota bacterium]